MASVCNSRSKQGSRRALLPSKPASQPATKASVRVPVAPPKLLERHPIDPPALTLLSHTHTLTEPHRPPQAALEKTSQAWQGVHDAAYQAAMAAAASPMQRTASQGAAEAAERECAALRSTLQLDVLLESIPGISEEKKDILRVAAEATVATIENGWGQYAQRVETAAKLGGPVAAGRVSREQWQELQEAAVEAVMKASCDCCV